MKSFNFFAIIMMMLKANSLWSSHMTIGEFNDAFVQAVESTCIDSISGFLKAGHNLRSFGATEGLYSAASRGDLVVLRLLLANDHIENLLRTRKTFIDEIINGALLQGQASALQLLLQMPFIKEAIDDSTFNRFLPEIGARGHVGVIKTLCSDDVAQMYFTREGNHGLLRSAIKQRHVEMVRFILTNFLGQPLKLLIDSACANDAIYHAAAQDALEIVQLLLDDEHIKTLLTQDSLKNALVASERSLLDYPNTYDTREQVQILLREHHKQAQQNQNPCVANFLMIATRLRNCLGLNTF